MAFNDKSDVKDRRTSLIYQVLKDLWPVLLLAAYLLIGVPTAIHVLLSRREVRSSIGWMGLIALAPVVGALLYILFGVNRIQRSAARMREDSAQLESPDHHQPTPEHIIWKIHEAGHGHFATLERLVQQLTQRPLHDGNLIRPLAGGDEAYPEMLRAIESAERSVALSTYIFDNDEAGRMFVDALADAKDRGVEVRVLVDDVGARYSRPTIFGLLDKAGLRSERFLPAFSPTMLRFFNMRNHRKLLIVDGGVGFTGGMNIREGCLLSRAAEHPVNDLHFRLDGPVVSDLQQAFAVDWSFSTDEVLAGPTWFPEIPPAGDSPARGISDGPDADLDHLRFTFMGALSCARRSVKIVTPYFLPENPLLYALNVCAMRGVEVDVILPSENNLKYVHWAAMATLAPLLDRGVRVWLTRPPFDHTKLMIVDDAWSCFGSTNWDARSLRLNFEFNVECYDRAVATQLSAVAVERMQGAKPLTTAELDARTLPAKLRDGMARLFLPYL